ncbi:hypothetical protein PSET11_01342 [Arthrobacter ulcerisalmonis]|uniref:DUF2177 family protein n=1 Tax=Arthrobacter ulcerisalmonis TaxID=2483813 RepID=A0A3P5WXY8_9MICC|nr:DUF2177 family protein [Arthrobacter ulcerisalmonis]VDC23900.1 hypothetical protein PSET11_01342 [Arthrobacter ulcerisalmonis]
MKPHLKRWFLAYGVTAVIFAALDVVWILGVANPQYKAQIGDLIATNTNYVAAVAFYLIYVAGMVHYGVRPNERNATLRQRVTGAALFGFFTYATWALTGLAVLKGFPTLVAITDIAWGTVACAVVTWLTTLVLGKVLRRDIAAS